MTGATLVHYLLLLVALICFFLAFVKYREGTPVSVGWLGFTMWMLDILIFGTGPK